MLQNINTLNTVVIPASIIPATPIRMTREIRVVRANNSARTRRNTAKFIAALDAGFNAKGRKGQDNRTNPWWLEIETFNGTLRALYVNVAAYITQMMQEGRACKYTINREGAIVMNAVETTVL